MCPQVVHQNPSLKWDKGELFAFAYLIPAAFCALLGCGVVQFEFVCHSSHPACTACHLVLRAIWLYYKFYGKLALVAFRPIAVRNCFFWHGCLLYEQPIQSVSVYTSSFQADKHQLRHSWSSLLHTPSERTLKKIL